MPSPPLPPPCPAPVEPYELHIGPGQRDGLGAGEPLVGPLGQQHSAHVGQDPVGLSWVDRLTDLIDLVVGELSVGH